MPSFTERLPAGVGRGMLDPQVADWLTRAPRLGAHEPIHLARREHHRALTPEDPPEIGRIEHLGLDGPHGTIPVRVYTRRSPSRGRP